MDEEIRFELSQEQLRQVSRLVSPRQIGLLMWIAIGCSCLNALQLVLYIASPASAIRFSLALASFVLWTATAIVCGVQRDRTPAREGALRISPTGMSGTLNGKSTFIPWRQIAGVRDVGDFLFFTPRRIAPPFAIPKASLRDPAATWALLEDRLISKSGLVRSSPPPTSIFNTVS